MPGGGNPPPDPSPRARPLVLGPRYIYLFLKINQRQCSTPCLGYWIYLFAVHGLSERTTVQHHLYCEQEKPAHCHGSLLLRLGTHQIQNRTRDAHKIKNQPTRYYDQADASYELGPRGQLGWGSGLALAIWVGLGRVGQEVKKKQSKK